MADFGRTTAAEPGRDPAPQRRAQSRPTIGAASRKPRATSWVMVFDLPPLSAGDDHAFRGGDHPHPGDQKLPHQGDQREHDRDVPARQPDEGDHQAHHHDLVGQRVHQLAKGRDQALLAREVAVQPVAGRAGDEQRRRPATPPRKIRVHQPDDDKHQRDAREGDERGGGSSAIPRKLVTTTAAAKARAEGRLRPGCSCCPDGSRPPMRHCIYPGTFDPITYGHLDVLARAARLFDGSRCRRAQSGQGPAVHPGGADGHDPAQHRRPDPTSP